MKKIYLPKDQINILRNCIASSLHTLHLHSDVDELDNEKQDLRDLEELLHNPVIIHVSSNEDHPMYCEDAVPSSSHSFTLDRGQEFVDLLNFIRRNSDISFDISYKEQGEVEVSVHGSAKDIDYIVTAVAIHSETQALRNRLAFIQEDVKKLDLFVKEHYLDSLFENGTLPCGTTGNNIIGNIQQATDILDTYVNEFWTAEKPKSNN